MKLPQRTIELAESTIQEKPDGTQRGFAQKELFDPVKRGVTYACCASVIYGVHDSLNTSANGKKSTITTFTARESQGVAGVTATAHGKAQ